MKGLYINNFYSLGSNFWLSFVVASLCALLPVLIGGDIIFITFSIQCLIFVVNVGSTFSVDVHSRWDKFELTMPITRTNVVTARYLFFLSLIGIGIFTTIPTYLFYRIAGGTLAFADGIGGMAYGTSVALLTSAFMYPIILKIGADKNELIIVLCAVGAAFLHIGFSFFALPFSADTEIFILKTAPQLTALGCSSVVFVLSYFLSCRIYARKEVG